MKIGRPGQPTTSASPEAVPPGIRVGSKVIPLPEGETTIGRGAECHLVMTEALVSRRHATISRRGAELTIEDLESANGTYVNQLRIHGKAPLFLGDHVFIATCEMEIVGVSGGRETFDSIPASPSSAAHVSVRAGAGSVPSSRVRRGESHPSITGSGETTTSVSDLSFLGNLADKMFTMGRADAALRILGAHLEAVRRSARGGARLDPALVDAAGRYAIRLAAELLEGRWVDLAIELHTLAGRVLREETIQQLAVLRQKAPLGDQELLRRYHASLRAGHALSPADVLLCERIACLVPGPSER